VRRLHNPTSRRESARDTMIPEIREASWSAPVLWRCASRRNGVPLSHSMFDVQCPPRGAALRGQPTRFFFSPLFPSCVVLVEKVAKPLETKDFACPKIVQKKLKKKLTPPCCFEILLSHTVTTEQKYRKQYEN
jgi:hypothetical protein